MSFLLVSLLLALVLVSCGNQIPLADLPPPNPVPVTPTREFPGVLPVMNGGLCTGTLIHPRAILTASHCLKGDGLVLIHSHRGLFGSGKRRRFGPGIKGDSRDLGMLLFSEPIGSASDVIPLGGAVTPGEIVRLVGYGCGEKRTGTNVVFRIDNYIELMTVSLTPWRRIAGPENRAETCPGDSGSPLLQETAQGFLVVGVLHGELREPGARLAAFINTQRADNRAFIETTLAELR